MDRSRITRLRSIALFAVVGSLVVALAGVVFLRGSRSDAEAPAIFAANPQELPAATRDTELQQWVIDAPEVAPEPDRAPRTPAAQPTPNVDWTALAAGIANVAVRQDVSPAVHADVNGTLTSQQTHDLIAEADAEAAGAGTGRLPGFVGAVVARGTPGGGGDCTPTSW